MQMGSCVFFKEQIKARYSRTCQQAIFSFIGAKLATLEWLRERCGENMHRLYFNYRSPKYLLDVFNTYANMELDVDPHFLPKTNNLTEAGQDSLCIMSTPEKDAEVRLG